MASKFCVAIMGVKVNDHVGINQSGHNYLDGMYKLPLIYTEIPVPVDEFKAMVVASDEATAAAEKGDASAIVVRNNLSKKVYTTIKIMFLPYLNEHFPGDRAAIEKAGANVSAEPTPVPPPDQPIISKITRGPVAGSIKVGLVRGKNKKLKTRSKTEYRVFMFAKPDDKIGKEIGDATDSRKLYGFDVTEDVYVWISVRAKNSGGSSLLASKVRYFLSSE
jgi:hypothetical protein